jgi:hypothetical protein
MRTLTSGNSKVHHIPARTDVAPENPRGLTTFFCSRDTLHGRTHASATATCKGCLIKLQAAEADAYKERERRRQRAEEAAAYERIEKREAEEKAAREATRVTPAVHVVELKALPNYGEDIWTSDASGTGEPRLVYRMRSKYGRGNMRFTIFYVGPDGEARRVHGGPVLSGPYCALVPMSSVISAYPGEREEAVEVKEGDVLVLNGAPMILIDDQPYDYPHAVTPAEYGARLAAREVAKLRSANIRTADRAPWDAALQEAHDGITSLYRNGHTVLPFAFESPAAEVAEEPRPESEPVEYRDTYVQYAGHPYRVLGSEGDSVRYGLWVQHAQNDDEPVLFVRMGPHGLGDLVAQCLHAWGMASTVTGEVIQWVDQEGYYVDRAGNERTDIQLG